ncbi:hypothetical protein GCM10027037_19600 [Mucilaginibacter koreensis]
MILTVTTAIAGSMWQRIDKIAYFEAMASDHKAAVEKQLELLKGFSGTEKEAYEGALLMKKAGLVVLPKDKLKYFKAGRIELETALRNDADNAEYHFLRLIIEEHAPKIVKYKADIAADAALVKKAYKTLPPAVQHAVRDYSKTSKVLSPQDFE